MFLGSPPSFFFPDSGLWPLIVASGRPGSTCASTFFSCLCLEQRWGSKSNLMVSGCKVFTQIGLLQGTSLMVCLPSKNSATETRTRVARVRAEYPNQLDYSGFWHSVDWHAVALPHLAFLCPVAWQAFSFSSSSAHVTRPPAAMSSSSGDVKGGPTWA